MIYLPTSSLSHLQKSTSMRAIIGTASLLLFCRQFFSLSQIPIDYHYHPDSETAKDFKKGNYVLSVKYFQHVLNKYDNPKVNDLVICEQPDRSIGFRVVRGIPKSYFYDESAMIQYYVPSGFIVLEDLQSREVKMECIGNVRGSQHFVLF